MKTREAAALACKILGLYLIISGLSELPEFLFLPDTLRHSRDIGIAAPWLATSFVAAYVVTLALGVLLWRLSGWLAFRMVPGSEARAEEPRVSANELMAIALGVVGLIVVMGALPGLAWDAAYFSLRSQIEGDLVKEGGLLGLLDRFSTGGSFYSRAVAGLAESIAGLALGLWLALKPGVLARFLNRSAGAEEPEKAE